MLGYADMERLTFARKNRWLTAQLDMRGYAATDWINKRERLQNKPAEAIVKVFSD
jgi:hypothetical protein